MEIAGKYESPEIDAIISGMETASIDQVNNQVEAVNDTVYTPSNTDLMTAAGAVAIMSKFVDAKFAPATLGDDCKEKGTEKLAVVLAKYDSAMPPWLEQLLNGYKEEIDAAVFFGGVAFKVFTDYKKHQKAEAERAQTVQEQAA